MARSKWRIVDLCINLLILIVVFIPILASIFVPIISRSNRESLPNANLTYIATASKGYYLEYGRYPSPQQGTDLTFPVSGDFMLSVMGYPAKSVPNPREINFIDPRFTEKPKGGFHAPSATYYDPWGTPYHIRIDSDYDEKLTNPEFPTEQLDNGVIAWSAGPDKDFTTWDDNIATWR